METISTLTHFFALVIVRQDRQKERNFFSINVNIIHMTTEFKNEKQ